MTGSKKPTLLLVDKEDPSLNQLQFRASFPIQRALGTSAWFPLRIAIHTLGGDFTARMNQTLRVEQGLTYGARINAYYSAPFPGYATLSTFTRPKDVVRALDLAFEQLNDYVQNGPSEEELSSFKDKINNNRAFLFETVDGVVNQLLVVYLHRLGLDFVGDYEARISKVSSKEAQSAAKETFGNSAARIVVVGNQSHKEMLQQWIKGIGGNLEVISAKSLLSPETN